MLNKLKNLFSKVKNVKGLEYVIIVLIVVLVLAVVLTSNKNKTKTSGSYDEYVTDIEKRLSATLSEIKGAGRVKVSVSVAGGTKSVIATDKTTVRNGASVEINETPVLVGGKVVVLSEEHPEITGIIVVSSGADNVSVKVDLMNAVTTFLDIDESKVRILTGK